MGWHKRDLLVERVEAARDEQAEAKQQFQDALEEFIAVTEVDVGDLETRYRSLKSELEAAESQADAVKDRIRSIENVAQAMFSEWEAELEEYTNPEFRRESQRQLEATRERYQKLIAAMRQAAEKMDPVLAAFRDHVLFLKHNLNARAIAALKETRVSLEEETRDLIRDMESSIDEASRFIDEMDQPPA